MAEDVRERARGNRDAIVAEVTRRFRVFGGVGLAIPNPVFAHGVDVREVVDFVLAALDRHGAGEVDAESVRCTCEWMHPMDGSVRRDWPAVLDPACSVHGGAPAHVLADAAAGEAEGGADAG